MVATGYTAGLMTRNDANDPGTRWQANLGIGLVFFDVVVEVAVVIVVVFVAVLMIFGGILLDDEDDVLSCNSMQVGSKDVIQKKAIENC